MMVSFVLSFFPRDVLDSYSRLSFLSVLGIVYPIMFEKLRLTNLIIVGQGPIALAVGAGGGCLDIFALVYHFSPHSPSLWKTP